MSTATEVVVNINPLVGRRFIANSLNIAKLSRIESGVLLVTWIFKPKQEDVAELETYIHQVAASIENEVLHHSWRNEDPSQF